uniref:Aldo_ket_red domain-containing protein n=1 Tax=Steinernema glaseri TaxID=37863 RepID=A0A1I7YLJ2_9BILA
MVRLANDFLIGEKSEFFGPAVQPDISYDTTPSIEMSNGVQMPLLGLGTTHSGGYYHDSVVYAIRDCKYRMIDTAKRYGVERELGIAIKMSGVPREQLFLNSKLWPVDFGSSVYDACLKSCQRLGTDYLDLYMTHFPEVPSWFVDPKETKEETWRQMERLYDDGIIRSIGVSNYTKKDLEELLDFCSVKPHVNQFEFHPCYNPAELVEFCYDEDIVFMDGNSG